MAEVFCWEQRGVGGTASARAVSVAGEGRSAEKANGLSTCVRRAAKLDPDMSSLSRVCRL